MTAPVYPAQATPPANDVDPRVAQAVSRVLQQLGAEHAIPAVLSVIGANPPATARTTPPAATLTTREAEVLSWIARGKTNTQIGLELYLTQDTVKTHCRRLYRKLGAKDRAHAVAIAYDTGLLGGAPCGA